MLWAAIWGCDGPDRGPIDKVVEQSVDTTGACLGMGCPSQASTFRRTRDDSAVPEDTGWRLGDEMLTSDRAFWVIGSTPEGVYVLSDGVGIHELRGGVAGGEPLEDHIHRSLPVREGQMHGWVWGELYGGGGLMLNEDYDTVFVYDASWSEPSLVVDTPAHAMSVADITNDGVQDLLYTSWSCAYGVGPYLAGVAGANQGRVDEGAEVFHVGAGADDDFGCGILSSDLNGDGLVDLVAVGLLQSHVFYGPLSGLVADASDRDVHVDLYSKGLGLAGDVDGDGLPELLGRTNGFGGFGWVMSVERAGEVGADDVGAVYECSRVVDRIVAGASRVSPDGDGSGRLLFELRANTAERQRQVWVTDAVADGGVHTCFDEGRIHRNDALWIYEASSGPLSDDGSDRILIEGLGHTMDYEGLAVVDPIRFEGER